jgi:hypothetical protein
MTTISANAKVGFDYMLTQGVKGGLGASDDSVEVKILPEGTEFNETKIVVLTVSSYLFRLMVLIYFTPDDATKEHFARINRMQRADMDEKAFVDAISEAGNMSVGSLNRELARVFPHIGMSTPNIIDKNCSNYLHVLKCGHIQNFEICINQSTIFHATLCVCEYDDVDFSVDTTAVEDTGELEMF